MPKSQNDKNTELLRKLCQTPGNKRCMDCQAIGPVYVVTDFGTFVCQTCSGIHREFGHRVKSISMATFKPEEIEKVKTIGNENARRIWLARWTTAEYPLPESGNERKIREFMRMKYQQKKWFDENAYKAICAGQTPQAVNHTPVIAQPPRTSTGRQGNPQPQQQAPAQNPQNNAASFWDDDNVGPIKMNSAGRASQQPQQQQPQQQKKPDLMSMFDNAMQQPAPTQQMNNNAGGSIDLFGGMSNPQPANNNTGSSMDLFGGMNNQMGGGYQQNPMGNQPMMQSMGGSMYGNQMGGMYGGNQMYGNQMGGQPMMQSMGGSMYGNQMYGNQMGGSMYGNQMGGMYGGNQMGGMYGNQMGGQPMMQSMGGMQQMPPVQKAQQPQPQQQKPQLKQKQPDVFASLGSYQPRAKPQAQQQQVVQEEPQQTQQAPPPSNDPFDFF